MGAALLGLLLAGALVPLVLLGMAGWALTDPIGVAVCLLVAGISWIVRR